MNTTMEDITKVLGANFLAFIIYVTNAFKVFTSIETLQENLIKISTSLAIIYTIYKLITDIIDRINKNK